MSIGYPWRRRLLRGATALALLLLLTVAGGWLWLSTSLPQTQGEIAVQDLSAPVEIRRDAHGVPTIRAKSENDAYFALGFLHAQDRLFQMDFVRRLASGRLSEIMGRRTLDTDRFMRLLDFDRRANADYQRMRPEVRSALDAYAAGVNAYLDAHRGAWPPEFVALRYRPERWHPSDSLLWAWAMALALSSNWTDEALRAALAHKLSPEALESLWPAEPAPTRAAALDPTAGWRFALGDLPYMPSGPGASNSWVLAGMRTRSGMPLLANDPHLDLSLPGYWYLVRMETPTLSVAGASAPGVPFVILGRNAHLAWSFTTTMADNQDLFVERLAADAPTRYLTPDGPRAFVTREETIKVRGSPDERLVLRETRHGPVISDAGRARSAIRQPDEVVALAWSCLDGFNRTAEAIWRMNHAADAAEFRHALDDFDCPVQNVLYADAVHIGFMAAGRVPVRKGLSAYGQMPAEGWTGAYDWIGLIPAAELPQTLDPVDGLLATANNDVRPRDYPYFFAARFDAPYRVDRIRELLSVRDRKFGPDDVAAMQMDRLSPAARALVPKLLEMLDADKGTLSPKAAVARALLASWDFRMDAERPEPTIFEAWLAVLNRRLFADDMREIYRAWAWWNASTIERILFGPDSADRRWCDDRSTPAVENCEAIVAASFAEAVAALARAMGGEPADWRWGRTHVAWFHHLLFRHVPVLADLTNRPTATGGDDYTLDRGSPDMSQAPEAFPHVHGAGFRAIYDLADLDASRFVIAGGQSGNPLSAHYDDLLSLWRDGGSLTIVGDDTGGRLILAPAGR
jgi:penicillin amidase